MFIVAIFSVTMGKAFVDGEGEHEEQDMWTGERNVQEKEAALRYRL